MWAPWRCIVPHHTRLGKGWKANSQRSQTSWSSTRTRRWLHDKKVLLKLSFKPQHTFWSHAGSWVCFWEQTPARVDRLQESWVWLSGDREGPGRRGEQEQQEDGGGGEGCYVPNCCIPTLSRSTLMQEIHLVVGITKEISSHDHPERSYVALSLSLSVVG